jgi:hypothetical protein
MRDKSTIGVQFRFKKNDQIGAPEAEGDDKFLFNCFVDNGAIASLLDPENAQRIVVGRTGSGKSALLRQLESKAEKVISSGPVYLNSVTPSLSSFRAGL